MATLASPLPRATRDDRFFFHTALAMALVIVAGFSMQFVMGRSSFGAPPIVHAHAIVFMGWVAIYVAQTGFAAGGSMRLHKRLGWVAAGWVIAMVMLGTYVTVRLVRIGHAPFFFQPLKFLILDPVSVLTFAGLSAAAIVLRRRTAWHRRLQYCGMCLLLGPAFGRLIPLPLLIPYAFEATFVTVMIFPIIGVLADLRRTGTVHPAWHWGIGTIVASTLLVEALTYSPVGLALYRVTTAGTPGENIAPLAYPPFPGPHSLGRP